MSRKSEKKSASARGLRVEHKLGRLKVTLVPTSITSERAISIDLSFSGMSVTEETEEP